MPPHQRSLLPLTREGGWRDIIMSRDIDTGRDKCMGRDNHTRWRDDVLWRWALLTWARWVILKIFQTRFEAFFKKLWMFFLRTICWFFNWWLHMKCRLYLKHTQRLNLLHSHFFTIYFPIHNFTWILIHFLNFNANTFKNHSKFGH